MAARLRAGEPQLPYRGRRVHGREHRSVYAAEQLAIRLREHGTVLVRGTGPIGKGAAAG
jgi:hypothetical protein